MRRSSGAFLEHRGTAAAGTEDVQAAAIRIPAGRVRSGLGLYRLEVLEPFGLEATDNARLPDRDVTPQSRGLLAVAEGFYLLELGDHRQLELSLPVYDALYAWCKSEVAAA